MTKLLLVCAIALPLLAQETGQVAKPSHDWKQVLPSGYTAKQLEQKEKELRDRELALLKREAKVRDAEIAILKRALGQLDIQVRGVAAPGVEFSEPVAKGPAEVVVDQWPDLADWIEGEADKIKRNRTSEAVESIDRTLHSLYLIELVGKEPLPPH